MASTEMVTVGAVAHQLQTDQTANETTPKSLANFMDGLPCARETRARSFMRQMFMTIAVRRNGRIGSEGAGSHRKTSREPRFGA